MIILSRKRIAFVILAIFVSICICLGTRGLLTEDKDTVRTVALPVSNKIIVIDAGHGKPDPRSNNF